MNAKHLRPAPGSDSRQSVTISLPGCRNICRQDVARAANTGGINHPGKSLCIGRFIEHDTAGAVDLKINETWRHDVECQIRVIRFAVLEGDDAAVFDFNMLRREGSSATPRKEPVRMDDISGRHVRLFRHGHLDGLPVRWGHDRVYGSPRHGSQLNAPTGQVEMPMTMF